MTNGDDHHHTLTEIVRSLADIGESQGSMRREFREMRDDVDVLAKEVRQISARDRKFARWGAFVGAILAALASIGATQCVPAVADAMMGIHR